MTSTSTPSVVATGGCGCGNVRYQLHRAPMIVHCCHCSWCQRESGSAFALNAMIEADQLTLLCGAVEVIATPSASGKGQQIARCPQCRIALWSHYAGAGADISFVRVGTIDVGAKMPPDIHIFTADKQPWVVLPEGVPAVAEYYASKDVWSAASLARRAALMEKVAARQAQQ